MPAHARRGIEPTDDHRRSALNDCERLQLCVLSSFCVHMNTAIAEAKEPARMARAMRLAIEAGREAYFAGRMGKRRYADPSSPLGGLI